jgi:hypothetical protein
MNGDGNEAIPGGSRHIVLLRHQRGHCAAADTSAPAKPAPAAPAAAAPASITGKVLEVKDVETYTYLRLKTGKGEIWAAVGRPR